MIVACVRTGTKYSVDYVARLRAAVDRHLPVDHRFVCLTDRPYEVSRVGIDAVDISLYGLPGWWGKMTLFQKGWRIGETVLYLDLDTVVVGSLFPLAALTLDFGICASFTRAAGIMTWPCKYGSCVMVIGSTVGSHVWDMFTYDRDAWMETYRKTGDQHLIENAMPDATLLQEVLPAGFFLGYRDLPKHEAEPPLGCSIVVFAGSHKPDNCQVPWVRSAWEV